MPRSYQETVAEACEGADQGGVDGFHQTVETGEDALVLDVREPGEWTQGHIPNAKLIPALC